MNNDILFIILIVSIGILVFLLTLVLLIKLGILGNKRQINDAKKIYVNDGKSIDFINGTSQDMGLNGFGEDKSETLLVGMSRKIPYKTICLVNTSTGVRFKGILRDRLIVGREINMTVSDYMSVNDERSMSRKHIEITNYGGKVYIKDLNSTNHTWVNGVYVTSEIPVNNGDIVKLGYGEYIIEIS